MTGNDRIATEEVLVCFVCGERGKLLYEGLGDRLFGAPGEWGFLKCPGCGLVWLNPRPVPSDLAKVYETYYTHSQNGSSSLRQKAKRALYATVPGYESLTASWFWRGLGKGLALSSLFRERALLGTMCLGADGRGKLLDVGCGNGEFLSIMRDAGWDVVGIEPDPAAAKEAEQQKIPVLGVSLAQANLPTESFDAITLNHVIEHVYEPVGLLRECGRLLKPEGKIVIMTPNLNSEGHATYSEYWVHLDPPRHLYLFSHKTLQTCCDSAGLETLGIRTSARNAAWTCVASDAIRQTRAYRRTSGIPWSLVFRGSAFRSRESSLLETRRDAGEELILVAGSPSSRTTANYENSEADLLKSRSLLCLNAACSGFLSRRYEHCFNDPYLQF